MAVRYNPNKYTPQQGRMMKEDGTIINVADLIAQGGLPVNMEGVELSIDPSTPLPVTGEVTAQLTGSIVADVKKPYVGYSTDDKSVIAPDAERGDEFIELDTKDVYFHDGTQWVVF